VTDDRLYIGELIHDGELYDHVNTSMDDVPFYRAQAQAADGPVLELCCGTGRLTLALREAGVDIVGLDGSASMLKAAARKAASLGLEVEWHQGDIRSFELGRRFGLVMIPFNSLQCLYTHDDLQRTLTRVERHLAPGGRFVFDIFNPSIDFMVERRDKSHPVAAFQTADGRSVQISETCCYDDARQVNRVKWTHSVDGQQQVQNLDMRCYYPLEMDALLQLHGWTVLHKYGSFDEQPFVSGAAKQIYVCRVAGD